MEYLRVVMVRENMRDIPRHRLPEGFSFRTFRPGDEDLWVEIQGEADRFQKIDRSTFDRNFGGDLPALGDRSFFLLAPGGTAAGSITAWYGEEPAWRGWGRIHWVAVRPAYQGMGLGKAMMTVAMERLAASHQRCYLTTATPRLPAIRLYLDFGFLPDMSAPGADRAWKTVAGTLRHPVLARFL
ncbi:MAG: GNAT family N-acetyltransferase [Planctomycetota bacterium]|nr:GNAT family N-acetyltransferase [Planctomycetota bacterium]